MHARTRTRSSPEALGRCDKAFPCLAPLPAFLCLVILVMSPVHAFAHASLHKQIEDLTAGIAEHPDKAELYLERGRIHALHQDRDAAMADYERAEMLAPKLSAVHLARGRLFQQAGWPQAAKAAFDRFLKRKPEHPIGLAARAGVQAELGRHLEAAEDYTRAIRKTKKPVPEYYLERARALAAAGDHHVDRALEGLDQGVKRLGFVGTLSLYSVELEVKRKRYDAALKRLDEILARSVRKERWFAMRGEIHQQAGRNHEAREAFLQSIKAIEALPLRHRKTRATIDLEKRVRRALDNPVAPKP